jgi:hypothetical protein
MRRKYTTTESKQTLRYRRGWGWRGFEVDSAHIQELRGLKGKKEKNVSNVWWEREEGKNPSLVTFKLAPMSSRKTDREGGTPSWRQQSKTFPANLSQRNLFQTDFVYLLIWLSHPNLCRLDDYVHIRSKLSQRKDGIIGVGLPVVGDDGNFET